MFVCASLVHVVQMNLITRNWLDVYFHSAKQVFWCGINGKNKIESFFVFSRSVPLEKVFYLALTNWWLSLLQIWLIVIWTRKNYTCTKNFGVKYPLTNDEEYENEEFHQLMVNLENLRVLIENSTCSIVPFAQSSRGGVDNMIKVMELSSIPFRVFNIVFD